MAQFRKALDSEEALIRQTDLAFMPPIIPVLRMKLVGPLLTDPVKWVRIEAVRNLTTIPRHKLEPRLQKQQEKPWLNFRQRSNIPEISPTAA